MTYKYILKKHLKNDYTKYLCESSQGSNNLYLTFNNDEIIYNKKCKVYTENGNEYICCGYNMIKKDKNLDDYIYERCNNKIKEGHICNEHIIYNIEQGFIDKDEFKINLKYNVNKNIIMINIFDCNNIFICKGIIHLTTGLESLCRLINIMAISIHSLTIPYEDIDRLVVINTVAVKNSYFFTELIKKIEIIYLVYKEIVRKDINSTLKDILYKDIIEEIINNMYMDTDTQFCIARIDHTCLLYKDNCIITNKYKIKYLLNMINHFYKYYRYMCINTQPFLLLIIKKLEETSDDISNNELKKNLEEEEKEEFIEINNEIKTIIEELYKKLI
jgi:hypothetical protein